MIESQTNWAGNYTYSAARLHYPETVEQVRELVVGASKLKVLGSRHSFNGIADSTEDLISLERKLHGVDEPNDDAGWERYTLVRGEPQQLPAGLW